MQGADVFIGVSAANIVTPEMVRSMNSQPIVMALANPEPEIAVELALEAGAAIVATGRSDYPNQINNVLGFPRHFPRCPGCTGQGDQQCHEAGSS